MKGRRAAAGKKQASSVSKAKKKGASARSRVAKFRSKGGDAGKLIRGMRRKY
jgi:hypothetical protein